MTMKHIMKYSICTFLLLFYSLGLLAQLSVNKTADQNYIYLPTGMQQQVIFTITVENTSSCDIGYYLTDDMRDSFSMGDLYGPQIISATSTDGYFSINPDISTPIIAWSDTIPSGQTSTLTIYTIFEYPWANAFYSPFDYTNTAHVEYFTDCCTPLLNDTNPDNDILCQCDAILADSDPLNDTLCNNLCQDIFLDNITENDYLCVPTIGNGPYNVSAETTITLEFCNDFCDAFFNHTFDECSGVFYAEAPQALWTPYEWFVDGNPVGTTVPTLNYTLSPSTHEVCGMTYDECFIYNCEWCVTVTVLDDSADCNAPFTYTIDPNTGSFAAVSDSNGEWFVDGLQAGTGNTFTTILSPGVHQILHFGTTPCGLDCEYMETVTVLDNTPCSLVTTITASSNTATCNAPTVLLEALTNPPPNDPNDYSYEWSGSASGFTGSSIPVIPTIPELFTVTVTDLQGCTATSSIFVDTDFTIPNIYINAPTTVLTNDVTSIDLEVVGTGNYTYNWWQMNNATPNLTVTEPGTYTVYVGNLDNGCGTQASITIEACIDCDANYTVSFNECTGLFQGTPVENNPFNLYEWSVDGNLVDNNPNFTYNLDQGTHEICLLTYGECSTIPCESCETFIVLDDEAGCNAAFTYTIDPNTGSFSAISPSSGEWFVDGLQAGVGNTFTTILSPGIHDIIHFGTTSCGLNCEYMEIVTVIDSDPCDASFITSFNATAPTLTCNTPTIGFEAVSNPPPASPTDYTYEWDGPGVLGANTANAGTTTPGTFEVTVTDGNGCTSTASITIDEDFTIPNIFINAPTTVLTNTVTSIDLEVVGTGNYNYNWWQMNNNTPNLTVTEPGTYTVYVGNLDNGCGTQESITITESLTDSCNYELGELELSCDFTVNNNLCIPLLAKNNVFNGIIGMDFCLTYDQGLMIPTGNVELGSVVLNGNPNASYAINTTLPGMVCVTIYYTSDAPVGTDFVGGGEIACVEFEPLSTFFDGLITGQPVNADFGIDNLIESYELDIVQECADDGFAIINQNGTIMDANIRYWDDIALPLAYDVDNPADHLITTIIGTDENCNPLANSPIVTPDLLGHFQYDINNGTSISLDRDINNGTQVMPTINGMDCYYAYLVTTLDPSFVPSPYQIIAMDVNMNGSVTAGDITHMQNRITLNIGEYPQTWNDNIADASKDWLFVDDATLALPNYSVSSSYPFDDGTGFYRLNVPQPAFCYEIPMVNNGICTEPDSMNYHAILLGDTDKSWTTNTSNLRLGEDTQIVLNIDEAIIIEEDCSLMIPIRVEDMEKVKAIDFVMEYNTLKLAFDGYVYGDIIDNTEMGMAYNQIENNDILFTSYAKTIQGIENNNTIYYYVKFSILNEEESIFPSDISLKESFVDGLPSPSSVIGSEMSCKIEVGDEVSFSIYPNPFNGRFSIELIGFPQETEFTLFFYDVAGKLIDARRFTDTHYDYENHNLAKGIYLYELKIGKELVEAGRLISQ